MFFKSKDAVAVIDAATVVADAADAPDTGHALEEVIEGLAPRSNQPKGKKKGAKEADNLDYEWQFATPFGKVEFELDPKDLHEEKERKRRVKAERAAAKKAERLARLAAREAEKRGIAGPVVIVKRNNLLPALVIFAILSGAIIIAVWLFARPGDEDDIDAIPPELRSANALADEVEPASGMFGRLKNAIRAGRRASRDAQREQVQKFEELSKQG